MNASVQPWKIWQKVPNAHAIADGLKKIPEGWALTPLQDKRPYRDDWNTEAVLSRKEIGDAIIYGEAAISRTTKKPYTRYISGYGVRTGDISGGKIAIDVDGSSAQVILEAISCGDLPKTVSWSSGKTGRRQMMFQAPDDLMPVLKDFTHANITQWNGLKTTDHTDANGKTTSEQLDLRYNLVQSALPPSRHPDTGSYFWINSPEDTEVAIAPQWLCDVLIQLVNGGQGVKQNSEKRAIDLAALKVEREERKAARGVKHDLVDFLNFDVLPRLSPEQIFNWAGHSFRQYGKTLKGAPPWRASASGTSFHVWWDGTHWAWQDKATGVGGGAVEYRWQLRGGNGTPKGKDYVGVVAELASDAGVSMPELPKQAFTEPDYTSLDTQQQEFEGHVDRHIEQQQEESLKSFFINRLERLRKFLSRTRPFKGFGKAPEPVPNAPKALPDVDIEFEEGDRKATIEKAAQLAQDSGKKIILDISEGGSGKSHVAGELTPESLGTSTLYYLSPSWRNPTVATIEQNYAPGVVRNNGLVSDPSKLTPLGNPQIHWAKPGETANLNGNCRHTPKFHAYEAKGYQREVNENGKDNPICRACKLYLQCAGIIETKVPGYTFLQERRNVLSEHNMIRMSLDSVPRIASTEDGESQEQRTIIIDETTQLKTHDMTQADLKDFDTAWMYFQGQIHKSDSAIADLNAQKDELTEQISQKLAEQEVLEAKIAATSIQQGLPLGGYSAVDSNVKLIEDLELQIEQLSIQIDELIERQAGIINQIEDVKNWIAELPSALETLEPLIFGIRSFLSGDESITADTRYGWNESAIRQEVGHLLTDEMRAAVSIVRKFSPKLRDLLHKTDTVTLDGMSAQDRKGSAATLKAVRKTMERQTEKENAEALRQMPSNCIIPVVDILLDQKAGSFHVQHGEITIYTRNEHHREIIQESKLVIVLDGTETRDSLAKKLECDPSEIIVVKQKPVSYRNLKFIQVTDLGQLPAKRSQTGEKRVAAIIQHLKELHGTENVAILDHKNAIDPGEEAETGYWFHDNRGSNRFQGKDILVTVGSPIPNISHLQMLYTTETGDRNTSRTNPAFDAFVKEKVRAEVVQAGWRPRSAREMDKQFTICILSNADLSYLRDYFPDAQFEQKRASEISINAAGAGEKTRLAILEAFKILTQNGTAIADITTGAIAKIVGCSRGYISRIANSFCTGGFEAFKRVLLVLLKSLYRTCNTPTVDLTEEEKFASQTYLPLLLEENTSDPANLVKEVVLVASNFGGTCFERALTAMSQIHRAQLLGHILTILPEDWQQEFFELDQEIFESGDRPAPE